MNKVVDVYVKAMQNHWSDQELYQYGMRQLKMALLNLATIILIGYLFGMVIEGIVFALCYVLLRKVSGGYHAGSNQACYIFSVLFYIVSLIAIKYLPPNVWMEVTGIVLFLLLIRFMPVDSENKRLKDSEKQKFRQLAVVLYTGMFVAGFVLLGLGIYSYFKTVSVVIVGTELLCTIKLLGSDTVNIL